MFPYTIEKSSLEVNKDGWERRLEKTVVINVEAYIVSMDRKTTVYGLEAGKIAYKLSIPTHSRISLACL